MRVRRCHSRDMERLPLTPMIDIIFLLLIFFVMTFQVVPLEADLMVSLPRIQDGPAVDPLEMVLQPPLLVQLTAKPDGSLDSIRLDDAACSGFAELNQRVRQIVGPPVTGDNPWSAIIRADANLEYHYTIDALSALGGYTDDSGRVVKLIETIRLAGE